MNILYYIPAISQQMGGIRQYAVALLKILATDTSNTYFVYHQVDDPEILTVLNHNPQLERVKTNWLDKAAWDTNASRFKRKLANLNTKISGKIPGTNQIDNICKRYRIAFIHCPYQYLPQSKFAKSICTMHDVQELHFPEFFTPEERTHRAFNYARYIKHADKIIVSYQHIKNDIVKYFKTAPDKIDVCLLEMDNLWFKKYGDGDIKSLERIGIEGGFIFYPANTWEHKNHYQLLKALIVLRQEGHNAIKLVCTGHKTAYYENVLEPFIKQNNLQDSIIFPGVLDEKLLYSLYKKCIGVVVPTLYEAGSFPLMESILLSVPVICSNVTSLPETIGDNEFIFEPMDAHDISKKLTQMWEDKGFRQKSVANCIKQAPRLTKTDALNIIKRIYNSL